MKVLGLFFGLAVVLVFVSSASAQVGYCCQWNSVTELCDGDCNPGFECSLIGEELCDCTPVVDVCHWDPGVESCMGSCEGDLVCSELAYGMCDCVLPPVDECRWVDGSCTGVCENGVDVCVQLGSLKDGDGICGCQSPDDCRWHILAAPNNVSTAPVVGGYCAGECGGDSVCSLKEYDLKYLCECMDIPSVPEFISPLVGLLVLLTAPALAYLFVRRRC